MSNGGTSSSPSISDRGPAVIFFDATTQLGLPAMVAFMAGKASDQWNSRDEATIQEAALCQLDTYFGSDVRREFRAFLMKNWSTEEHIQVIA